MAPEHRISSVSYVSWRDHALLKQHFMPVVFGQDAGQAADRLGARLSTFQFDG